MRVFLVRYPPCPHAVLLVRCLLSAANGQSERGTASAGSNSERHGGPRELPAAPASGPGTELNTSRERLRARPHVVGSGSRATRASAVARARRSAFPPPSTTAASSRCHRAERRSRPEPHRMAETVLARRARAGSLPGRATRAYTGPRRGACWAGQRQPASSSAHVSAGRQAPRRRPVHN
jgi:hypothetical protein